MNRLSRAVWLPAALALCIGFLLRVLLVVGTPVGSSSVPGEFSSYNDEIAHANYTAYLLSHHELPAAAEAIDAPGAHRHGRFEYYQPPLYYLLHAALLAPFVPENYSLIVISGRILSLLLGALIFPVFYRIMRELNFAPSELAAGLIFLSLSMVLIRFQSICSNDSLFWLLTGLIYWSVLRLSRSEHPLRIWIVYTLLSALTFYTKLTALLLLPLPLVEIIRRRSSHNLSYWIVSLFVITLLTIPLWLRNLHDFGSLFPLSAGFGVPHWRLPDFSSLLYAYRSLVFPWSEFWHGIIGFVLISVPVAMVLLLRVRNKASLRFKPDLFSVGFAIVLFAFIALNFRYNQAEARYLFAAWPALALFVSRSIATSLQLWLLTGALLVPLLLFL